LKRRLHLDLSDYTEYLGSLALVVPDPVLRRVQHFLVPAEGANGPGAPCLPASAPSVSELRRIEIDCSRASIKSSVTV
jgi:hypothetical protein